MMCTYSVRIDDALMSEVRLHFSGEEAVQKWLEQQVKIVVTEFVRTNPLLHPRDAWSDYKLSDEVEALTPRIRKPVYGDYKVELATTLEEKYR